MPIIYNVNPKATIKKNVKKKKKKKKKVEDIKLIGLKR